LRKRTIRITLGDEINKIGHLSNALTGQSADLFDLLLATVGILPSRPHV
jgi:hypothetical protein